MLVSVLLKWSPRHRLDIVQLVACNYAVATALALLVLQPSLDGLRAPSTPWPALLALAVALPALFLVLARSVRAAGIVRSDVAQRLSLLLSLAAAFVLFGEAANAWKLSGLAIGVAAMVAVAWRPAPLAGERDGGGWPWLLAVWAGFALIDVLLKRVAQSGLSSLASLTVCFALAFVLSAAVVLYRQLRGQARVAPRHLAAGALLGVLNFANILFYVRAHQALPHSPATVFATMNIGVVVLGALVGTLAFGERTSWLNRAGLVLAVVAIGVIAYGSFGV